MYCMLSQHPSVFDCIRDVVDQLQGDPYNFEKEEKEDDQTAEEEAEPEPEKPEIKYEFVMSVILGLCHLMNIFHTQI